jgi:uncharacterized protein YjiS (DUF1127 family)
MRTFSEFRAVLRNRAAYRRTISELKRLPLDARLDLDIYDAEIPAIARRAVYGA